MRKYLLLGGTGAIGEYLIENLLKDDKIEVYVTTRKKRQSKSRIIFFQGDAHNYSFLENIINSEIQYDTIIDFLVWTTEDFKKVYKLFLKNSNRYMYMSSARVYSNEDDVITENTTRLMDISHDNIFLRRDSYVIPKSTQEDILKNSGFSNYVIIRPYIIYSEKRLPLCGMEKEIWLYRALHGRTVVMPDDIGMKKTELTFGDDCARALYLIVSNNILNGEVINISIGTSLTWNEVLEIYKETLSKKGIEIQIKTIKKSIKIKNGDYQSIYDRMFDRTFDVSKLKKILDVKLFVSMSEGLKNSLCIFLDNPIFNEDLQDWRFQAQLDAITHERARKYEFKNKNDYIIYILYRYLPIAFVKRIIKRVIIFFTSIKSYS